MKPRILSFLYFLPPAPGTAPKRNWQIARAMASRAEKSIVYTVSYPDKSKLIDKGMEIRYNTAYDYRRWLRRNTKDGYLPEQLKQGFWKQWAVRLINTFPFSVLLGEGGLFYFFNLVFKGRKTIRTEKITHLYSSFRPFADHYAAYWLKKLNPHLYWIADFRDLMVDPHYHHIFFEKAHHRFFKRIFSKADLLTTVSEGLAKHLLDYNSKVITLRNGIEGEIIIPSPVITSSFVFVYTGSMVLHTRNAEPLFLAISQLNEEKQIELGKIKIIYAGKDGAYWRTLANTYNISSLFEDHGIISNEEAAKLQTEASINILLTMSSDHLQGVLTGKMIEYFRAGSPVLGIIAGQNDPELHSILNELQIGNSFSDQPQDLEGIKAFIYSEYLHWKETGMNRKPVNVDVLRKKYAVEETMKVLFERIVNP